MKEKSNSGILFPETITYTFDYQQKNFWRCRYTSAKAKSLHYTILLPLDVKPISVEPALIEGCESIYTIGIYQTVVGSKSPFIEIAVTYEHIENDIDASEWLDYILMISGETIIHSKDYYSASGNYSDVLTKNDSDGNMVISRIRVFKNYDFECKGANIIMVKVSCLLKNYITLAEDMLHCANFFTFINDSKWHLAEELKSINLDLPANFSFYYPATWKYLERCINEEVSYLSLLLKKDNKTCGIIDGYFFHHEMVISKEQICEMIIKSINNSKYVETETLLLTEKQCYINRSVTKLWSAELKANDAENKKCELTIIAGSIEENGFYLIGSSLPREQNFKLWATGKRAINIILDSMNNYDLSHEDKFYV